MVLAESVVNSFGQTLLNAGCIIGSNHKRILKTWNLTSVSIKSDDDEVENKISSELLKFAEDNLKLRLLWQPKLPAEIDLYNSAILHLATKRQVR
ncbi:hypothetical protein MASR1M45_27580 [Candidatus Kapaibacterium sp.]